jgi:hypothetical protein
VQEFETPSIIDATYLNVSGVSDRLNVRAEPWTASPVVARVLAGTLFPSGGCELRPDRTLCRVKLIDTSATEGWAAAEFL